MLANEKNTPRKELLLVDDDLLNQRILSRILHAENYNVTTVDDGEMALHKIKKFKYDAIISDLNMPNLNGIQLIETLLDKNINIPVLFLSGETEKDIVDEVLEKGAVCFLTKPVDSKQLLSKLKKAI
jgi:CheY-like chemotaxis protein